MAQWRIQIVSLDLYEFHLDIIFSFSFFPASNVRAQQFNRGPEKREKKCPNHLSTSWSKMMKWDFISAFFLHFVAFSRIHSTSDFRSNIHRFSPNPNKLNIELSQFHLIVFEFNFIWNLVLFGHTAWINTFIEHEIALFRIVMIRFWWSSTKCDFHVILLNRFLGLFRMNWMVELARDLLTTLWFNCNDFSLFINHRNRIWIVSKWEKSNQYLLKKLFSINTKRLKTATPPNSPQMGYSVHSFSNWFLFFIWILSTGSTRFLASNEK